MWLISIISVNHRTFFEVFSAIFRFNFNAVSYLELQFIAALFWIYNCQFLATN
jgi:hypothetical protein